MIGNLPALQCPMVHVGHYTVIYILTINENANWLHKRNGAQRSDAHYEFCPIVGLDRPFQKGGDVLRVHFGPNQASLPAKSSRGASST